MTAELVRLDVAAALASVTVRQLRARIHEGRLPAARVGKSYRVRLEDVRALFAPVVRPARVVERTSPNVRAIEQLSRAGFVSRRA